MKPAAFEYLRPSTLEEALTALASHGDDARILAGGQSLVPMMNARLARPGVLVDINRLPDLDSIRVDGDDLVIGALVRHSALKASPLVAQHCPLMAQAYPHVAHVPIRNRGTLAGNISHADPASEMPAVLLASDAIIVASSAQATRNIAAADFFVGTMRTALASDEMVIEIRIPRSPADRGHAFDEVSQRQGDFALAAVAVALDLGKGHCTRARLALAGVGDCASRLTDIEELLTGGAIDGAAIGDAAERAAQAVTPNESFHADADYKRDLVRTLVKRTLVRALEGAG